jgi:hypothetical protein
VKTGSAAYAEGDILSISVLRLNALEEKPPGVAL